MVINYKKVNDNTKFDGYFIPNKQVFFNRKWTAKVDIGR